MKTLVVATTNPGKLQEMQKYLAQSGWELELMPPDMEIVETEETFAANACLKATDVAKALGKWAIADDSGLSVAALNGAPGIYSARYAKTDKQRIDRVLRELAEINGDIASETEESSLREAEFICAVAVARPDGTIALLIEGRCPGEILHEPRGDRGFGYDPIFYVPEVQLTFAEMTPEMKRSLSHRGKAFEQVLPRLSRLETNS
ncbi:RdgB/HAM1 family non-canonical purine NTP pyrophosphatase [Merismopedia glauca]|uniref:dITP/XTP pyrophosphatase n=1 Tax=Merismopedia glauca CCAP 1448/3 TaxID=1296344 RepID=A0A2T1C6A3_9CYAN|nr:RdgB/HAM1 family non-canonical purine NTP pyrophosphatase [Merismopedia glauca]PSB03766.1 non-canonical purine NTP pyrophosphatase, RdgB/HAM1 family [Merismopedia glauca CCAP 1448/3]